MRRMLPAVLLAAFAAACGGAEPPDAASEEDALRTEPIRCATATVLKPENEVRPADTTDPVESVAFGVAFVQVRLDDNVDYQVFILNRARETFVAGHVHEAPAGSNGPVVVPLFSGSSSNGLFVQRARVPIAPELATRICADRSQFYVNYHTTQDPQGAVRGQLH
jgi:hypothetical protein